MREEEKHAKNELYAGIVWILSGTALIVYGIVSAFNAQIPGTEELIRFLASVDGKLIYLAAFISIFIEGLYFIGSFFPGSSLVVVLAVLSQAGGAISFLTTITLIFIGWSLAGAVNIYGANAYRAKAQKLLIRDDYEINDRVWTTWFPAFRASYEVAQVTEGGHPTKVFISSLRARFWASLFMGAVTLIVPIFFDIKDAGDREGYATIAIVAGISLVVGMIKIKKYRKVK